ncbi:probable mitochondrial import inner membrane translocase subunit [Coccomyxa sp. Obi]|nr:probable mitochondrial import inner membrane translocase subunit [Coccomyxa sp. Obi]
MAGRLLANLIVAGGGILIRAAAQAYKQAIVNAQRSGVTAESVKAAASRTRQMSLEEAEKILGINSSMSYDEVLKKYNHLFENNEKFGTFYLQSKVYRARERLEQEWGVNLEEAQQQKEQPQQQTQQHGQDPQQ